MANVKISELPLASTFTTAALVPIVAGGITERTTVGTLIEGVSAAQYGAVGDGVTDDTTALQNALSSGAKLVRLTPGSTYIVSFVGTKTFDSAAQRYCLLIPSGVILDGNGATIKLAATQNAALLMNSGAGSSQDSDTRVWNVVLDGNKSNQTSDTAEFPCIHFYNVLRAEWNNINVQNARDYFGQAFLCDQSRFTNLHGTDSDGDGWRFGVSAGTLHCTNSFFDNIYAQNCTGTYSGPASHVGNGVIFTLKYCNIGKVESSNVAGGNKIQNDSQDVSWAQSFFRGGANTTANSGTKIQGTAGQKDCVRINIGLVVSESCYAEGLYISETKDCSVGIYCGNANGTNAAGTKRDVFIDESNRPRIGAIHSFSSGSGTTPVVVINTNAVDYAIGSIQVGNPAGARAVQNGSTGYGTIESIEGIDSGSTMTETYIVTSTSALGKCGNVRTSIVTGPGTLATPPIIVNCINKDYEMGKVVTGSTDTLEGSVTLSAGTSTSVTCGHIYKEFVGTSGTDHYWEPIIQILPETSAARALGSMYAVINRLSTVGTGFAIKHANAAGTEVVQWKVLGYKVLSVDPA